MNIPIWIVFVPILNIIIPIVVCIIHAFRHPNQESGGSASYETRFPDGEEYKDKVGTPERDNPPLWTKVDGRLTNVFKNPWEGIL